MKTVDPKIVSGAAALNRQPTMFSGDGNNPSPGPMTAPFAIYDMEDGWTYQITFSPPADGEVTIISATLYVTPPARH